MVKDVFRYHLPHQAPKGKAIFWVPYWRFKGMRFVCTDSGVIHRFVDVSGLAVGAEDLPGSLGLRGQAMRLSFVTAAAEGRFLHPELSLRSALRSFERGHDARGPVYHQTHIGETVSLIYAPFYREQSFVDAVLNRPVGKIPPRLDPEAAKGGPGRQNFRFLATLCPTCGWEMEGAKQSTALTCHNCRTVWKPGPQGFEQVPCAFLPSDAPGGVYFPFWRIHALIRGIPLASYADLIRIANMAQVVRDGWDRIPFTFWIPGFKVRAKTYLNLCRSMTLFQPKDLPEPGLPGRESIAVTLPASEAAQSLKICLATFIKPDYRMRPLLPKIETEVTDSLLVFVPFRETHHEFVCDRLGIAVPKSQMATASNL